MKFGSCLVLLAMLAFSTGETGAQATAGLTPLGDSGLALTLPKGWRRADKKPDHEETFGAFQSDDSRASVFLSKASAPAQADMTQIMNSVLADFEAAFVTKRIGDVKTGRLADSIAAFATFDADMRSAKGPERLGFRFYLAVIDTGRGLYLFQGSCQTPINPEREREIVGILRSLARRADR